MPNTCWPLYDVRIFKDGTYDNYLIARGKARKAEMTSELNSDVDKKTSKRRIKRKVISSSKNSSSENESILPEPPAIKKRILSVTPHTNKNLSNVDIIENNIIDTSEINSNATKLDRSCTCCPVHQQNNEHFKDILRKQCMIRAELRQLSTDLHEHIQNKGVGSGQLGAQSESIFYKFEFPLSSIDTLENDLEA